MSSKRYPEEFKIEAFNQVIDRGHSVSSVVTLIDITTYNLYAWIPKYGPDSPIHTEQSDRINQTVLVVDETYLDKGPGRVPKLAGVQRRCQYCYPQQDSMTIQSRYTG